MMCLHFDVPLGQTRHSDSMICGLKGGLGFLKQILGYWMSLNIYIYICSVIAKQLEFYNSVSQVSRYTGYIPVNFSMEMRTSKGQSSICFLSKMLNSTNALTPIFHNFTAVVFNLLVGHKTV